MMIIVADNDDVSKEHDNIVIGILNMLPYPALKLHYHQ